MKIKELMTARSLQFCSPQTNLKEASALMKKANCGALPIVDENRIVVGILTDRDIALSLSEHGPGSFAETKVEKIMSRNVRTIKETDDLKTALKVVRDHGVGRLPVVNAEGRLTGIISMHHLLEKNVTEASSRSDDHPVLEENLVRTIRSLYGHYASTVQGSVE